MLRAAKLTKRIRKDKCVTQAERKALKARRILIRYYDQPRLDDKLRITIGTEAENAELLQTIGELL